MITYGCENQKYENNFDNREKTKKSMKAIYSEYKKNFSRNKYRKLSDSEVFSKIFFNCSVISTFISFAALGAVNEYKSSVDTNPGRLPGVLLFIIDFSSFAAFQS